MSDNTKDTPMDYTLSKEDKERIEKEAALFARYNYNGDVVEGAMYRGYYEGVKAEMQRRNDEVGYLKTQLKIEQESNDSLKLELQKQKELNAELVAAADILYSELVYESVNGSKRLWGRNGGELAPDRITKLESLIKKSSEI